MTGLAIGAMIASLFFVPYAATASTPSNSDLKTRLAACGSLPNGALLTVVQTTRLFINLPKEYFPNIKLKIASHGATAGSISNGGAYGHSIGAQGRPNCWSYYLDFELTPNNNTQSGTVDIASKNAFSNLSNYLVHFKVVVNPPSATKRLPGNGTVIGNVLLGPICPVEHNPPDPACAPRSYETSISVQSTLTGSPFKDVPTDASGIFTLSLAPGRYLLSVSPAANGAPYPRCTEVRILVVAKKSQKVTVNCDTGIR